MTIIPTEVQQLWESYLATERIRLREQSLGALNRFIVELLLLPTETWFPWARHLAFRVIDEGEDIPIRLPLFRAVVFPALLSGMQASVPGSARCLAGFSGLLCHCRPCAEQLSEDERTEFGLLRRAVRDAPDDVRAKQRLRKSFRSRFDYSLHELPAGVLYDQNGATVEQCDEMLDELAAYESLVRNVGATDEDQELIEEARFHIPAYQAYLKQSTDHPTYEEYLSATQRR